MSGCLSVVALGLYDVVDLVVWVMSKEDLKVNPREFFTLFSSSEFRLRNIKNDDIDEDENAKPAIEDS